MGRRRSEVGARCLVDVNGKISCQYTVSDRGTYVQISQRHQFGSIERRG